MIQIFCRIIPVMGTHRQHSDFMREVAIWIFVDSNYLIAITKVIRSVIRIGWFDFYP